jgi:hypothetical protein
MAAGRLDEERVREAARVLLEHRRHELPSVSIAVAARLLAVSRTTVLTVSTIPTKLASKQIDALRGKVKASFLLAVEAYAVADARPQA